MKITVNPICLRDGHAVESHFNDRGGAVSWCQRCGGLRSWSCDSGFPDTMKERDVPKHCDDWDLPNPNYVEGA
jgi:hypothetical protein